MKTAPLAAMLVSLGCSVSSPPPQASAGAASGGCEPLPIDSRECMGKCALDLCEGDAGDPLYRLCDDAGTCRFPAWSCESSRPGAPCEGGRCTVPIVGCDGPPCVSVSYCCTGCLDAEGLCRPGNDGKDCGLGGAKCAPCK